MNNGWNGNAVNITNSDGTQSGWFNTDVGNSLTQVLPSVYEVGMSYQLTVGAVTASQAWSGSDPALMATNELSVQLYYGADNVIATQAVLGGALNDSQGALTDIVATLGAVQAGDAWAGQSIGIRVISTADNGPNGDWAIDNVRLDSTAVPEPSTSLLLSLLAMAGLVRRRR